ncbi:UDP-GlcNAc:betaGal beta-1,3-N-acetylglucosaminyltransferase-like protein 1 isoform X10 [Phacochoerus africanus]|uniref:UDP-GlcNAc:betaGal beta-1,3-N-acetylglucosaminyltransferase-like protein 1 isoform X10 n=1 Tax=Phacochoerus africanus TaxID=41426 RepID=UPI001FD9E139|nr:UDP-GlcNAc:betaGal beta-1,3-N-acetylglucosaminyltransferase-like protein 1 isoform X10 [Phacochoerus africanus]
MRIQRACCWTAGSFTFSSPRYTPPEITAARHGPETFTACRTARETTGRAHLPGGPARWPGSRLTDVASEALRAGRYWGGVGALLDHGLNTCPSRPGAGGHQDRRPHAGPGTEGPQRALPGLRTTIWTLRVRFLEEQALPRWATFTIWNAGRQGRRLYRSLTAESRHKVVAFCDVDENKIQKGFYCHEESQERPKPRIPVLHFRAARPPFVICVKLVTCLPPLEKRLLRSFACFLWVTAVQRRRKSSLRFPPKAPSGASANALPTPNRPLSTSCSTLTKSIFCFCLTAPVLVSQLRNHHPIQGRKDSSLCFL